MRTGSKLKAFPTMIVATLLIVKEMPAQQLLPDLVKWLAESKRKSAATIEAPQDEKNVYNVGGDVSPPYLISKVEPKYSKAAETAGLSGSVRPSLVIDATGVPVNIKVTSPLGLGLDENAVEAVSKWRFRPGTKAGSPVATRAQIEVHFQSMAGRKKPPLLPLPAQIVLHSRPVMTSKRSCRHTI